MTDIGGRKGGYAGGRLEQTLPQDASNTIFVEGLPADCTRREVSHIFCPFVGFKEVRLVNKSLDIPEEILLFCALLISTPLAMLQLLWMLCKVITEDSMVAR